MDGLRVASLNMNGGRDRKKRAVTKELFQQKKLDVILLQETHSDSDNETEWVLWTDVSCVLSHGSNFKGGVAICISTKLDFNILSSVEIKRGRALVVVVEIEKVPFSFINVYAPNSGPERVFFFEQLRDELLILRLNNIIMGGDWNCTLQFTMDRMNIEPHPKSSASLNSMVGHLDLCDTWRLQHPGDRQYTWCRVNDNTVSAARLDRIYISHSLRSTLSDSSITPVGFTDHHLITAVFISSHTQRTSSHWHFNNKLLQEKAFCQNFSLFWENWRGKKAAFESLGKWWEIGKAQIRVFCQQYTSHSTAKAKAAIEKIETEIRQCEEQMEDPLNNEIVKQKKRHLSAFLQERVKGALVRSRFMALKDMDAPTAFFFNLEKKEATKKLMACLRLPDGLPRHPGQMRQHAVDFYSSLFKAEECDQRCAAELLQGLPRLSDGERVDMDRELSLKELTTAAQQLSKGRAPGLDGLSADFYQQFWGMLGPDLHTVFMDCFKRGELPASCRSAVVSLLPKKGDLASLKNWRPVALLCTDYKILSRALFNRLRLNIEVMVHMDQSYCIPGRTLMDNLFLMRDVIDMCKVSDTNIGILSLDKEKYFDRIDHTYLFSVFSAFGVGDVFTSWVKLIYNGASCMVKVAGGLSKRFKVERGIRQGCPLSGQLYSLAIEPFLNNIRNKLNGFHLLNSPLSMPLTLAAYADDVNIFISEQADVSILKESISLYGRASSAKVNWAKCEALYCGTANSRMPTLPSGLQWKTNGMKVLGVYLGDPDFEKQNWEGVVAKVCARLSKWHWLLPQLSYRGRVLVINNLVASTLWHRLKVLSPPGSLIDDVQKHLVDFFWTGQHWIPAAALYLPVEEGGQGLMDVRSKMMSFRLQTVQRLLYQCGL